MPMQLPRVREPILRAPAARRSRLVLPLLLLAALLLHAPQCRAQGNADESDLFAPVGDGPGIQGRVGHNAFPTFGRDTSLSHAELFPYILDDNQMFFGDLRLFMTNYARMGGNLGLGYRIRPWGGTNIFGASLWYDADDSLGTLYQDIGLSLESYGELFDLRLNGYLPIGETEREIADRLTNPRFVGNDLIYDRLQIYGKSMPGVDYEFGVPLPLTVLRQHNVRFYLGAYHFAASGVDSINGVKTRLEGSIIPSIDAQVSVTSDKTFGTNAMVGISWTYFGGFERTETNQALRYDRMGEFVQRNYNVIVGKERKITAGVQAINPATDLPFIIQHVGAGGNSSGAPDDPWGSIADAQAAGGVVILVHAGTVLTDNIVLEDGQVLLGQSDGLDQFLAVQGYGNIALPNVVGGDAPIIQVAGGNAVTLDSNTVFAGFHIDGPAGHGIFGDAVTNVLVGNVTIDGAGGDGIFLQNATGRLDFVNAKIFDAGGAAFHVDGGNAEIGFRGQIDTSTGRSLLVENTTDGTINFTGSTILDDGGDGVLIQDNDGDVIVDNLTVKNATGVGVEVRGGEGNVGFMNTTTVTDASGTGVLIEDRDGDTAFHIADVEGADGQTGLHFVNNAGEVLFNRLDAEATNGTALRVESTDRVTTSSGTLKSTGGAALDFEDSTMNLLFHQIHSDGGVFGIRIVDSDGTFVLAGGEAFGSGGFIKNATTAGIILENSDTFGLKGLDLQDNAIGLQATNVDRLALTNFRVTESTSHALDLLNVGEFHSVNSQYVDNGSLDASIVYEVDTPGSYVFSMTQNTVITDVGDAIRVENMGAASGASLNFSMQGNAIRTNADFATGVDLDWDGVLLANFYSNGVNGTGDDSIGLSVNARSTTIQSQVSFASNLILMEGDRGTALLMNGAGPSEVIVSANQLSFEGTGGTGLDFSLAQSADVTVFANTIADYAGGATGMLFRALDGPSTIEIEQNLIDLRGPNALVDRGIIFQSITDQITLRGDRNNEIRNATSPFFAPAGGTTGTIRVNGQKVP